MKIQKSLGMNCGGFAISVFGGLAMAASTAHAAYDIAREDFIGTQYIGEWVLKPQAFHSLGLESFGPEAAGHYFTTALKLADKQINLPDLVYTVGRGEGPQTMGVRIIPVSVPDSGAANPNPDAPGAKYIDALLRQVLYGAADSDKQIYSFVTHATSEDAFYDLTVPGGAQILAEGKIETSTHHVSTYYGNNKNSRRNLLDNNSSDNVFVVSLKDTPQEAIDTNAMLWAKLYYENPQGYLFSEDYSFDYFVNNNLEEVLAFGTAWLDHNWVRKDLNAQIIPHVHQIDDKFFNPETPYYSLLKNHDALSLYCFEGVTNSLNLALNIPLTLGYFKRIWGPGAGTQMFVQASRNWLIIQANELDSGGQADGGGAEVRVPGDDELNQLLANGKIRTLASLDPILSQIKPLWESDLENSAQYTEANPLFARDRAGDGTLPASLDHGPDPRAEQKTVGRSLAWMPETTSDILRDFIYMYAPFHKVGGATSAALILGFKDKMIQRTGIEPTLFDQKASQMIGLMLRYDAALMKAKLSGPDPVAASTAFQQYQSRTEQALLRVTGRQSFVDQVVTPALTHPAPLPAAAAAAVWDVEAWNEFVTAARPLMAEIDQIPIKDPKILEQIFRGEKFVAYYSRPGLPTMISHGIHPTNPRVKLMPIASVVEYSYALKADPVRVDGYAADQFSALNNFSAGGASNN